MFIDELDAVGGRRESFRGSNSRQTINQLLNEIGGFRGDEGVLIMAATNEALRKMEAESAAVMSKLAGGLGGGFPF